MIKISQKACENSDKCRKKRHSCSINPILLIKKKRNYLSNKKLNHDHHDSHLFDIAKLTTESSLTSFWWRFDMSTNLSLGKSCSEIKYYSPQATSGFYAIDTDKEGSHKPFTVFCDMINKNGVGVTVISHDSEARMHVKGYDRRGSYVRDVHYNATGLTNVRQLASLTNVSTHCEQFIKYECHGSHIFVGDFAWWVSRTGARMTYWGGATPAHHKKCACGVSSPKSCATQRFGCNCDKNDGTWREDSGLLTEKSHLPVTQLRFGDTGGSSEEGYHTLGKLKCYGMELE